MKDLSMNVDKIWHSLMSNLIYPAILGSIIYSFVTSIFKFFASSKPSISTTLGVNTNAVFICLSIYSFLVICHYCTDYLYTLHSPRKLYGKFNFLCDIIISGFLAASYTYLIDSLSPDQYNLKQLQNAMTFSWLSMTFIYLIFLAWDIVGYRSPKSSHEYSKFYLSMIRPFEISGILIFAAMALLCRTLNFPGFSMTVFAISSIAIYFFYTSWFWRKLMHYVRISSGQK